MSLLISRTDFNTYNRKISDSAFNKGILDQFIRDAQFVDLKELVGDDFYFDMITNSNTTEYQALINGGIYQYGGKTYTNVGLKAVIVHFAYARYVLMGSNTDTPFGMVVKQDNNSQQTPANKNKMIWRMNKNMAVSYWENARRFIERNKSDYPLFNSHFKRTNFKISKINGKEI